MERIGKPTLGQQAYQKIHTWIVNGDIPKGTVTSEGELSKRLDMSRTPVRAALQQLELEGYIRIASKHGIIILDSSSQRVSDLLEVVASLVLFSITTTWQSKREELLHLSSSLSETIHLLLQTRRDDSHALITFELELLRQFVMLRNNSEMTKTFQTVTSRLFWNHNYRRWQAPYTDVTSEHVTKLIHTLAADRESFQEALFHYLHTLKRTWQ